MVSILSINNDKTQWEHTGAQSCTWSNIKGSQENPFSISRQRNVAWLHWVALNANVAVFLWFLRLKRRAQPPCERTETESFSEEHLLPLKLYQTKLLLQKQSLEMYHYGEKKTNWCFLTNWIPYTIFIKVHLSAISLPRKTVVNRK